MAERNRAFSGARAKFYFEGTKEAGWATGVNGTVTYQLQRVDVVGDHRSQEIEVTGMTVAFTLDFIRILKRSLKQMGIRTQGDTATVINTPGMTFEVYDSVGDSPMFRIKGAKFETLTFRVDARGLMSKNASFQAIDFEELEVA